MPIHRRAVRVTIPLPVAELRLVARPEQFNISGVARPLIFGSGFTRTLQGPGRPRLILEAKCTGTPEETP